MASRRVFAVVLVALAGCGASQARSETPTRSDTSTSRPPERTRPCAPAGSKQLDADALAQIFQQGRGIYGCARATRRSYRLGSSSLCTMSDRAGPIALSGTVAAYGVQRCGVDTGTAQVLVRRLTDGRVLHSAPATSRVPGAESYQSVVTVVVRADGGVGWIAEANSIVGHGASVIEVHRYDSRGQTELDRGPGIAARSLRLRGSQLSWLHSGRARSATLS